MAAGLLYVGYTLYSMANGQSEQTKEISFQEFKTKLLGQGMVARLEVANNAVVKVRPVNVCRETCLGFTGGVQKQRCEGPYQQCSCQGERDV